jgi:FtsH-binding integral membrane protein
MTERYITLVGLPIAAFYIYFPDDLLGAFLGSDFAGAGMEVSMLAAAGLFTALASPHIAYMIKDDKHLPLNIYAGILLLTLAFILCVFLPDGIVPSTHGLTKTQVTAMAVMISSLVGFILIRLFTASRLECRPHPRILAHILCTGITVATLTFVAWYFDITDAVHRVFLFAGLGVLIYGTCLYLAGEFLQRDFRSFKELTKED